VEGLFTLILPLIAISMASCLVLAAVVGTGDRAAAVSDSRQPQAGTELEQQLNRAEQQLQSELIKQRNEAEQQAEKSLDKDGVSALEETQKAIDAIAANKIDEAMSAIERATAKINNLLARNPDTAVIRVDFEVNVVDTAPHDHQAIIELGQDASYAVDEQNFPAARVVLHRLMSEIRVRTYNLPLATFPDALKQAERLLKEKENQDAVNVLLAAVTTLVAIDRVTPIPMLVAREAINQAQAKGQKDKAAAQHFLEVAKDELQRSKELGYAGRDPEYAALNEQISSLEKQMKGNGGDLSNVYAKLKERLSAFLKRQSEHQQRA
jgi:hypothetical protein